MRFEHRPTGEDWNLSFLRVPKELHPAAAGEEKSSCVGATALLVNWRIGGFEVDSCDYQASTWRYYQEHRARWSKIPKGFGTKRLRQQ
ncbi:MAG: hypothetical protein ACI97A_003984 [Planctomycetota bacterium]